MIDLFTIPREVNRILAQETAIQSAESSQNRRDAAPDARIHSSPGPGTLWTANRLHDAVVVTDADDRSFIKTAR